MKQITKLIDTFLWLIIAIVFGLIGINIGAGINEGFGFVKITSISFGIVVIILILLFRLFINHVFSRINH